MIEKKKILSNLFWKFAERILAQSASFVVSIILARLLYPSDYGIIALSMIFVSVADVFVVSGFSVALIQKDKIDNLDYSTVFWFSIVISIIMYIILFILSPYIAIFFGNNNLKNVLRVIGLHFIIKAVNSVQHAYVSKNLLFKRYFFSTLFGTLFSGVIGIILAYNGYGVWALVCQFLINSLIDTIILFFTVDWRPQFLFSIQSLSKTFKFGKNIFFDGILGEIQVNFKNAFIGKAFSITDLAYFTKGKSIPNLFVNNLVDSVSSTLLPTMSYDKNDNNIIVLMKKASQLCSYLVFPILLGLFLVSREFILIFLTEKWMGMLMFLKISSISLMFNILMTSRNEALKAIGRSDIFFYEHTLFRVIDTIFLIIFIRQNAIIILVLDTISRLVLLILVMMNAHVYNHYHILNQILDIKNTLLGCLFLAITVSAVNIFKIPILWMFVIKIFVGVLSYCSISILLKFEEFENIVLMIKMFFVKVQSRF